MNKNFFRLIRLNYRKNEIQNFSNIVGIQLQQLFGTGKPPWQKIGKDELKQTDKNSNLKEGFFHIDIPFSLVTQKQLFKKSGYKSFKLIYIEGEFAIYVAGK